MVSEAVRKAMRIAVLEAHENINDELTAEHILIGLFSIDKLVNRGYERFKSREEVGPIPDNYWWSFHAENENLNEIFYKFGLDSIKLRKSLRAYLLSQRSSDYEGPSKDLEKPIHDYRWDGHELIKHASGIALLKEHESVNTLHLLMALMEKPGEGIREVLSNIDLTAVRREAVLKLDHWLGPNQNPVPPSNEQQSHLKPPIPLVFKMGGDVYMEDFDTPYLAEIGTNLTRLALENRIESLIGREDELVQIMKALNRKKKNNPLLVGEAGVGKTAMVRALAQKIVNGQVPQKLMNTQIYEIDMNSVVAGTRFRGDMEQKMQIILNEARNPNVILFIDEFHTVMGAGLAEGTVLDASNMMKPLLERGEITCIGATTISEYRRHVEKDKALVRRFQTIQVKEPSPEETLKILWGLRDDYEKHYKVQIFDEALRSAVDLSTRYFHQKKLPDKALDILDDACASKTVHKNHQSSQDKYLVEITEEDVVKVVEIKSGVPIKVDSHERKQILKLEERLQELVVGQDDAIKSISKRLMIARAGLKDPKRPFGVFLFMGPTGVGKTLLAKSLAQVIFGKGDDLIRLDMSEYMDPGSLSKLIGAPPGFVGTEEGQLSGLLRTKPYSVVLLDEMEKAHPLIFDMFLQVFDEGWFTDGKGTRIDARNTIFIMTSNLTLNNPDYEAAYGIPENQDSSDDKARQGLLQSLRPEFVNRIDEVINFNNLKIRDMKKIARNLLKEISDQTDELGLEIDVDENALEYLALEGYHPQFGARPLRRKIEDEVKYPLSEMIITGEISNGDKIRIKMENKIIKVEKKDLSALDI